MGREGDGLHELTRKRCDFLVSLPTTGPVKSLNVSVATGVVLFEAVRQRRAVANKPASSHASTAGGSLSDKKSLPTD
jgi:23S rRNA (guanosine2251-2'-O)-methyltransferase